MASPFFSRAPGTPSSANLSPFFLAQSHPADQISASPDDSRFQIHPATHPAGAIGDRRQSSVGTIGEGRRPTPVPTPTLERREEEVALGLPAGTWDALDGSVPGPKSRPSSFILDVLPQTRERSGPPTPSLSLDSVSQPPSTTSVDLHPLPSPHSLAPSSYLGHPSHSTSSTSLPLSSAGALLSSASRTSSPGPLDTSSGGSSPSVDALAAKVSALEGTVSGLSTFLATEFRTLKDEVGLLRSLVTQQQQQPPQQAAALNGSRWSGPDSATDSPLFTLRSPSPGQAFGLARPPYLHSSTSSSLAVQPATSPGVQPGGNGGAYFPALGVHDPAAAERLRSGSEDSASASSFLKDEQIKLLTAQVSQLSSTVSQLLSASGGGSAQQQQGPQRGMSLPLGSPALGVGATGLGMSGAPTGLGVGVGRPSPMLRTASGSGLARTASMRSASGAAGGLGGGGGAFVESASAWDGGMSSPMLGGPSGAGLAPGGAGGNNPPGSLGAKWEVLGVGQDLFRAIAKYGLGPPTKIQGKAIPCVVRGQDAVAQAPAIQERIQCYVIPALQIIYTHAALAAQTAALEGAAAPPPPPGIQVVVVTATVDQAAQAQRLAVGLGGSLGIRTALCVGSSGDLQSELQTLLKAPPHVLVGTPQKLLDLFALRSLPTSAVRLLVVDECDQLIARNLAEHVLNLARLLPPTVTVPVPGVGVGGGPSASPIMSRSPLPGAFDSPFSAPMSRFGSSTGAPTSSQGQGAPPTLATIDRQMAIFSCTVPQDVLAFASSLQLREPVKVLVRRDNSDSVGGPGGGTGAIGGGANGGGGSGGSSMRGLKMYYLYLAAGMSNGARNGNGSKAPGAGRREAGAAAREWKLEALADLCEDHAFEHAVVFASSIDAVEAITYRLGTRAVEALALHQDMGATARAQILAKFRSTAPNRPGLASKRVLVVYDALSRGMGDVGQVPLVINFDMPRAVEDYVHRIACATGQHKNGMVLNIVTPGEVDMLRNIESFFRVKILELPHNFATTAFQ